MQVADSLNLPPNNKCGVMVIKHEHEEAGDAWGPLWWILEDDGTNMPQGEWIPLTERGGEPMFDGSQPVAWYSFSHAAKIARDFGARLVTV